MIAEEFLELDEVEDLVEIQMLTNPSFVKVLENAQKRLEEKGIIINDLVGVMAITLLTGQIFKLSHNASI